MRYVVDASVAVKWYVPEIHEAEATRLHAGGHELHAPELITPEFANIVWKKTRLGDITETEGRGIVSAFARSGVRFHSHNQTTQSAFTGACLTGQTVYDWTYLSLALVLSCSFVTADERFFRYLEPTSVAKHVIWIGDL